MRVVRVNAKGILRKEFCEEAREVTWRSAQGPMSQTTRFLVFEPYQGNEEDLFSASFGLFDLFKIVLP